MLLLGKNCVPNSPVFEGELEIPGFSSYLQPFGNGLLLGIGQQVSVEDIPDTGEVFLPRFRTQELKVSLFDVRDPANPLEIGTIIKADSFTPAEFDYRALSVFQIGNVTTFGLPIETWAQDDVSLFAEPFNSLMLIDVDESLNSASLNERLLLTPITATDYYVYAGEDRSVITTDGVYYLRGNQIWFHSGIVGQPMMGPF